MRRLNQDKIKTMYVKDAVVYEDQPSTIKDTFKRYKRMSGALNSLFYTQGIKSFLLFFVRWKWTYIDMFLTLMFIPVCVLMCLWLPIYYAYVLIYHGLMGNWEIFWTYLNTICYSLAIAFVAMFILQALLAVALEHKRIKAPVKKLMPAVFLFPFFMIIYAVAITLGVFSRSKWHEVKRNTAVSGGLAVAESAAADDDKTAAESAASDGTSGSDGVTSEDDAVEAETADNAQAVCDTAAEEGGNDVEYVVDTAETENADEASTA